MTILLKFVGDDVALVRALRHGHPGAAVALYDRHAPRVLRTLQRILGADHEIPDLVQEVFINGLREIRNLRDDDKLEAWLLGITIVVARSTLRRRSRRRLLAGLYLLGPETRTTTQRPEAVEALRDVYEILERMPAEERIAFSLRIVDGLPIADAAEACGVSASTFKRRLTRAERRFRNAAATRPSLGTWREEGTPWTLKREG